jgi:hypothetical protein
MKKGDKVVILYNPHHKGAEQIIGTIKDYKGERICGSDIYYVEYTNPADSYVTCYITILMLQLLLCA